MSASQQVTGIASGFDTASIVEQLMKIEKIPYDKLDIKKQTQQLKRQAYQAVNNMFLKFRTSVSSLSSQKLWRSKSASSTNEKCLTATANEYAVNGSYSLKVAQLATSTQFMSKGFASSKTAIVKQKDGEDPYKVGSIVMNSAKSRVDNSAKVDTLNGGKGIYRGSVRVTDAANHTSIIDLSSCDTMDDIVRTLNESTGAQITASIKEGRLHIVDESNGSGSMKIQNVGAGTTATDLGINGSANADGVLHGRNVYTIGNDTALTMLQDGLGIEEGVFTLRVSNSNSYIDVQVSVDDCSTVGDIVKRVNQEIEFRYNNGIVDKNGGGDATVLLKDLKFGVSKDKNSFSLTNTTQNFSYTFFNDESNPNVNQEPATQLGLTTGRQMASSNGEEIIFGRVLGDVDSPMLKNLSGVNGLGIGSAGTSSMIPVPLDGQTLVKHLNGGKGLDISRPLQIMLTEGGDDISGGAGLSKVYDDIFDVEDLKKFMDGFYTGGNDPKLSELIMYMNSKIASYAADPDNEAGGLSGMQFKFHPDYRTLVVEGAQGGYKVEIGGTMAADLGLTRADSLNSAIELSSGKYSDYAARKEAIDKFYGWGAHSGSSLLASGEFVTDPAKATAAKPLTTLYDLVGLHGVDTSDGNDHSAAVRSALSTFLSKPFTMEVTEDFLKSDNTIGTRTRTVNVDLSTINFGTTDYEDIELGTFIDKVNTAIQDAFDADALASQSNSNPDDRYTTISAPKMRVHTLGDRLQWSNVDFTADFKASGAAAVDLGLDKEALRADFQPHHTDVIRHDLNPWAPGYIDPKEINSTTAGTVQLGHLNNGAMLTFSGEDSDPLNIDLGAGKQITITMGELRSAVNAASSLNTSLADYADILTNLCRTKLDAIGQTTVDIKFRVGENSLEVYDLANADHLVISGTAANASKTAVGPVDIQELESGKAYKISSLKAAAFTVQDNIVGLGDIKLDLGGTEVTLNTSGLDENSTLSQLISHLNDQLQELGKEYNIGGDPTSGLKHPEFADVKFTINSSGTGIAVENNSSKSLTFVDTEDAQKLAQDLGLIDGAGKGVEVDSYSFHNSSSLGRKYFGRATSLKDYMGTAENGSIRITNAGGASYNLDLSNCKTVGDVLDAINSPGAVEFGVQARLNDRGDGIEIYEAYPWYALPSVKPTGNVSIADVEGGSIAKKLGIAGSGTRDPNDPVYGDNSVFKGSAGRLEIDVMSSDTLESLMYRISEKGGYKTAIINDGTSTNPYRLTISSANTGEASDFVIESDLEIFGFNQTSRGKDSKVLYGDPNSSASPIMLSSSTNSNSNAILGLTLDLKSATNEWVTINVDTDREKVTEEIKNMVQTYNDLNDLVSYLDAYDEETGEPGVLFGDTSIRKLMEDINDMFYLVFNPDQKQIGSVNDKGDLNTWTWMDMGVSLTAKNSNSDGSGNWYSSMDLDIDKLDEMVAKNWDLLYSMLAGQRNASDSTLADTVKATASFNGKAATDFSVENAINGDSNTGSWGVNNGFMADGTIKDGENEYTIYFQKPTTISRMSIYHYDSETALKNFDVEYLDASTGKWEKLREIKDNSVDANHLGMALPTTVSAIRISATSTNAADGKFRLLDVQVFEDIGLAGQLNHLTTALGDSQTGFLAERNDEITSTLNDIEEQMMRLQERLDLKEANLWKRFTAMESALGQLQNQSSYFTSMMDSMSTSKKK